MLMFFNEERGKILLNWEEHERQNIVMLGLSKDEQR
jgi:hypothetical protein